MSGLRGGCRRMERLAQAVADGAATEQERALLDAHATACPGCRKTLAETRRLRSLLRDQPARTVSDGFEGRLAAVLAARTPDPRSGRWERLRLRYEWQLRTPALLAAVSLAAALVVTAMPHLSGTLAVSRTGPQLAVLPPPPDTNAIDADWEGMQASVELSTGSVLDQ